MKPDEISTQKRILITIGVMLAALMQVIDSTIVNVSLPHMQGSFAATPDQITWVLTSYLVSSGIFMLLTGFLNDRLGQKKYLLWSIAGFIFASLLCGISTSLFQIVVFRILQGVFGAALVPISQTILSDIYPPHERGKAMALWGMGVMIGPVLGPTLGGYLTEIENWRWVFYVNLPVGLISLVLVWYSVIDTPKKERSVDWIALLLLSTAICCIQFVLDQGTNDDWFDSLTICIVTYMAIASIFFYFVYEYFKKNKQLMVFNLSIFKDRNFSIASFIMLVFGLGIFGSMVIMPLMLENLLNYPVLTTGLVMAPRGIAGLISMIVVGRLINKVDPRWLLVFGIILVSFSNYLGTNYNMEMSPMWVILPIILQGFGIGMVFVPLTTISFSTLATNLRPDASGIYSLTRVMGSSAGISIIISVFTRNTQMAWNQLGGMITPYNSAVTTYLQQLHLTPTQPLGVAVLGNVVFRQAQMIAFVDSYYFVAITCIIMLVLVPFIKKPAMKKEQTPYSFE